MKILVMGYDKDGFRTVLNVDVSVGKVRRILDLCVLEVIPDDTIEVHAKVESKDALQEILTDALRWGR